MFRQYPVPTGSKHRHWLQIYSPMHGNDEDWHNNLFTSAVKRWSWLHIVTLNVLSLIINCAKYLRVWRWLFYWFLTLPGVAFSRGLGLMNCSVYNYILSQYLPFQSCNFCIQQIGCTRFHIPTHQHRWPSSIDLFQLGIQIDLSTMLAEVPFLQHRGATKNATACLM